VELKQSLVKAVKAIDKLSAEKATMGSQLEQQALWVRMFVMGSVSLVIGCYKIIHLYILCPSLSTITTLTSRMDKLETDLEAFKSVRLRVSTRHHERATGDPSPRYSRRTNDTKRWSSDSITSVASYTTETHRGPFIWQMPFTVKCIGTFKWVPLWGSGGCCKGDCAPCLSKGAVPFGHKLFYQNVTNEQHPT